MIEPAAICISLLHRRWQGRDWRQAVSPIHYCKYLERNNNKCVCPLSTGTHILSCLSACGEIWIDWIRLPLAYEKKRSHDCWRNTRSSWTRSIGQRRVVCDPSSGLRRLAQGMMFGPEDVIHQIEEKSVLLLEPQIMVKIRRHSSPSDSFRRLVTHFQSRHHSPHAHPFLLNPRVQPQDDHTPDSGNYSTPQVKCWTPYSRFIVATLLFQRIKSLFSSSFFF